MALDECRVVLQQRAAGSAVACAQRRNELMMFIDCRLRPYRFGNAQVTDAIELRVDLLNDAGDVLMTTGVDQRLMKQIIGLDEGATVLAGGGARHAFGLMGQHL